MVYHLLKKILCFHNNIFYNLKKLSNLKKLNFKNKILKNFHHLQFQMEVLKMIIKKNKKIKYFLKNLKQYKINKK